MKKKLFALVISLLIIFSPQWAFATEGELASVESAKAPLYGKTELAKYSLGDKYLALYESLDKAVKSMESGVNISSLGLSKDQFMLVYETFVSDNPQYFWVQNGAEMMIRAVSKAVVSYSPMYFKFDDTVKAKADYELRVNEILEEVDKNWTENEKVKYLHDYLCKHVSYSMDSEKSPYFASAYGALVDGMASCEGYSRALQDLLIRLGIQSFAIIGDDYFPGEDTPEGHMWNLVKIDGNYYHLDLTWDDQNTYISYDYYNVSTERILVDHLIDDGQVPFPICYDYVDNSQKIDNIDKTEKNEESKTDIGALTENEKIINGIHKTKVSISTSASTKAVTIKISKEKGYKVDSYQIYRSTSGKSGTFKKIKNTQKVIYKNTGLSKGKRYYYKVRGVRKVGDKTVYTEWSNVSYRKAK